MEVSVTLFRLHRLHQTHSLLDIPTADRVLYLLVRTSNCWHVGRCCSKTTCKLSLNNNNKLGGKCVVVSGERQHRKLFKFSRQFWYSHLLQLQLQFTRVKDLQLCGFLYCIVTISSCVIWSKLNSLWFHSKYRVFTMPNKAGGEISSYTTVQFKSWSPINKSPNK